MIRILTSVEITKDNPEYLRFKYNDNSYQEYLITTGKPKTCTTYVGNNMALVKSTFLEKRVAIKSTLSLNIVSTELTLPLNSVPPSVKRK
jgi:hypothetical protein